jgi:hypothetical protein
MDKSQSSGEFTESQRAGLEVRQADQDRTLAGMHRLEAMLAAAAPGREQEWRSEVSLLPGHPADIVFFRRAS